MIAGPSSGSEPTVPMPPSVIDQDVDALRLGGSRRRIGLRNVVQDRLRRSALAIRCEWTMRAAVRAAQRRGCGSSPRGRLIYTASRSWTLNEPAAGEDGESPRSSCAGACDERLQTVCRRSAPVRMSSRAQPSSVPPSDADDLRYEVSRDRRGARVRLLSARSILGQCRSWKPRVAELRSSGIRRIVLDLSALGFMDSSGLRCILERDSEARQDGFSMLAGARPDRRAARVRHHRDHRAAGVHRRLTSGAGDQTRNLAGAYARGCAAGSWGITQSSPQTWSCRLRRLRRRPLARAPQSLIGWSGTTATAACSRSRSC